MPVNQTVRGLREVLSRHLAALVLSDDAAPPLPSIALAATVAVHLLGLAAVWRYYERPVWLAIPTLALLLLIPILVARSRGALAIEILAPLFFLYAILAVRFVFVRGFSGAVSGYFDFNAPDLSSTLFRIEPWTVCVLFYTLMLQARYLTVRNWPRVALAGAVGLMIAAFGWASLLYVGHRTSGVTGSDPYAYAQMGIDLATHGAPLHRFTLFPSIASLGIPWSPVVHIGYHIPIDASGDAATVWPIGGSIVMALAYRLLGESGIYFVNPLASLLFLAAMGWLALEIFGGQAAGRGAWGAALSVAILATSHTLFDWATVPMVDAQAGILTVLAIGLALRFSRQPRWGWALVSGCALGAAYFIRHTQVLVAPAIFILLWCSGLPRSVRWRALVVSGAGALFVALPDLWYHAVVFGGVFNVESTELSLFTLQSVISVTDLIFGQLLAAREFGWLLPFVLYGGYRMAREKRSAFAALSAWLIVLFGFHLLYPALRLRDLLPEFPALAVFASYGVVAFTAILRQDNRDVRRLAAPCGFLVALFILLIRVWNILPLPWVEAQPAYGYVTAAQRAAFEQIAVLTPTRAVVGSMGNTGPIELYGTRETFVPTLWGPGERAVFIDAMFREGRRVFLLDDDAGMTTARHELEAGYTLREVAILDVPVYSRVPDTSGALWEISAAR
ncbi:MAG TPA: glycosyltransferase family 39 protein [Anaerolineae bacterium]